MKEAHTDSQERLPEYHVKARNTSSSSENKIHDEQIARQYGFRGALVPGVTVYAYLTHPLVEAFGAAWLERGTGSVRFVKPVHDGEEVLVSGAVTAHDARSLTATVSASTVSGGECATLTATLPAGATAGGAAPGDPRTVCESRRPGHAGQRLRRGARRRVPRARQRRARTLSRRARLDPPRVLPRPGQQGALSERPDEPVDSRRERRTAPRRRARRRDAGDTRSRPLALRKEG